MTANKEERLWRMMYRAWYRQLRDGDAEGIRAYREVAALRRSLGAENEKMEKKLANYIAQAQRRLVSE